MHRAIRFRGKRIDNGEWVYGYLVEIDNELAICPSSIEWLDGSELRNWDWRFVDPATVGQYTGLKDKNGIEIYEGDVVCNRWGNYYTPIFRNGIYMAYNIEWSHWMQQEPSTQFNVIWKEGCEVIGNIHDNPELLEVE